MKRKSYIISSLFLTVAIVSIFIWNLTANRAAAQKSDDLGVVMGAVEYNARNEFSLMQGGTNGLWNYGYSNSDADNTLNLFVPGTNSDTVSGCNGGVFERWLIMGGDQIPGISRHNPALTCQNIPSTALFLHPGPSNQRAVLRFNVPSSGTFQIIGSFQKQNPSATTDLKIIKNAATAGETVLYTGVIGAASQQAFNFAATLAAGDKIDFSVGDADNGYFSDGSSIAVTIGQPVTACLTAPANLQVNVPAENSPVDVQSVNTNASLVGDATYTNTGKVGRAFDLDGNGDYVRIEDNPAQRPTNQLTAEGWFKFNTTGGSLPHLISKPMRNSVQNSYALWFDSGNIRIGYTETNGNFIFYNTGYVPQTGVFNHYAMTLNTDDTGTDANTFKLFVNGAQVFSGAAGLPIYYNGVNDALAPHPLLIGADFENNNPQFFLNGQADEVSVYGRALAQTEIFDLVQHGSFGKCAPVPCAPPPSNLVSWYAAEQNALDSRSNNHGNLQNGATFAAGRVGRAFNFDGADDKVAVPNSPSLDITGNQLTIEAWINPTNVNGDRQIVSLANSTLQPAGRKYGLFVQNGSLGFEVNATGGYGNPPVFGAITPNVWTHVAGVYNGSQMIWYINGSAAGSFNLSGNIVSNNGEFAIGQFAVAGASSFLGAIDEVGIYNRALSQVELQSIVNAGQSGKCKPVATNPAANQIAWFSGDGDARDFLGLNPTGILRGDANFRVGKVGQTFNFDGSGDYVEIADDADHRPASITVEGWFKVNSLSGSPHFVSKPLVGNTSNSYVIWYSDGQLRGGHGNSSGGFDMLTTGFTPNLGEWYHYAYTIDDAADTHRFYINGVQIASGATTLPIFYDATPHPLLIGAELDNNTFGSFLNGRADEVSLYSRALSASEIAAVYNAGVAGKLKSAATPVNFAAQAKTSASFAPTTVQLSSTTVTFRQVTSEGITSQSGIDLGSLPKLPEGAMFTGLAYDISTTAGYQNGAADDVQVCFNIPALQNLTFANLRIYHLENGAWTGRTQLGGNAPNLCTDNLPSLSPFVIVQVAPTSALATIGGRVLDQNGNGISRAIIALSDLQGNSRQVITSAFGYYEFEAEVGQTYVLTAKSKRYAFAPPTQVVNVNENVSDVNFIAQPIDSSPSVSADATDDSKPRR